MNNKKDDATSKQDSDDISSITPRVVINPAGSSEGDQSPTSDLSDEFLKENAKALDSLKDSDEFIDVWERDKAETRRAL